jgi:hypothetical protein
MTQSAGVDAQPPVLVTDLQNSKVNFLVDAHFQDLILVDSQTGQHFPFHHRHRPIPISQWRTYLRLLHVGLTWARHQLKGRRHLPPYIIHIDLTINDRDVIEASADFVREVAGEWIYSPTNVIPANADTATP